MGYGDDKVNYSIVNGKAYTEDNVLVYNIFVHNIPRKTTKEQTLGYFKKFGEIESVRVMNDRKRKNIHQANKIGFVNFCDPTVAAKVLQNSSHFINNKRIRVRACDSWHQPGAAAVATKKGAGGKNSSRECEQNAFILNLNYDCLEIIFRNLSMVDQINLARTCRRLRDVFCMHSKLEYKTFHLGELEFLSLWQARQFLEMAGPQMETLDDGIIPYIQKHRIINFLGTFCTNVKNLSIHCTKLKPTTLRKLLKNMTAVTKLELNDAELCDSCIPIIKNLLPNLKVLSLEDNYEISGKFIKDLTSIESLSLNGCRRMASRSFAKICEGLTELNTLDIHDCPLLKVADIKEIVKHLNKLETLKISSESPQIQLLAELPKLKHLLLFAEDPFHPLQSSLFEELAKHQSNQLETLCIDTFNCLDMNKCTHIAELKKLKKLMCPSNERLTDDCLEKLALLSNLEVINLKNCNNFTDKGLLGLIKSCHKLHTLNIASCKQIKEPFPKELLDMLKAQRTKRDQKKPLNISACRSGFDQFAVSKSDFESATDLLKFNFDYQFDGDELEEIFYGSDYDDDNDDDMFFGGMLDDDDDDLYYYYNSGPDDLDVDLDFGILRHALFDHHPYGDGKFINDLTNIESLSLRGCRRIASHNFAKICESLTELNTLDIRVCRLGGVADIKEIVKHLNKLETLKISTESPQMKLLAALPKLKHLLVFAEDSNDSVQSSLFEELSKHQSNQLETLCLFTLDCLDINTIIHIAELKKLKTLMCPHNSRLTDDCLEKLASLSDLEVINLKYCRNFTDKGLLGLIKSCHKLHTLNISSCKQIRDTFPKELLDMLKAQRTQRDQKKPLNISAIHSGFDQFSVSKPDFESATDLLKFNYDSDEIELEEEDILDEDIRKFFAVELDYMRILTTASMIFDSDE